MILQVPPGKIEILNPKSWRFRCGWDFFDDFPDVNWVIFRRTFRRYICRGAFVRIPASLVFWNRVCYNKLKHHPLITGNHWQSSYLVLLMEAGFLKKTRNSYKSYSESSVDEKQMMLILNLLITSSTAQGGGGSFKNRKRIGEIDCCEWRMSEQKHWPTD